MPHILSDSTSTISPTFNFLTDWAALIDDKLDAFISTGVMILDDCYSPACVAALQKESGYIDYKAAVLTHGELETTIRGDSTRWIDADCPIGMQYLASIEDLGRYFNRMLYAGIRRAEAHYARYPAGFGYQWHRDNPSARHERIISAVYYLNADWTAADGGEVLVIDKFNHEHKLRPKANRLVIFDSNLSHQVNITHRPRFSIATWLRSDE